MVHSRKKGARGEREAAREIARLFHVNARRGRQYQGTDESPDILTDIPQVSFEVKRCETFRLYDAIRQAVRDAGTKIPIVLHRQNGKPWVAIVRLDDLPVLAAHLARITMDSANSLCPETADDSDRAGRTTRFNEDNQ